MGGRRSAVQGVEDGLRLVVRLVDLVVAGPLLLVLRGEGLVELVDHVPQVAQDDVALLFPVGDELTELLAVRALVTGGEVVARRLDVLPDLRDAAERLFQGVDTVLCRRYLRLLHSAACHRSPSSLFPCTGTGQ